MTGVDKRVINNVPIVKIYTEKFKTVVERVLQSTAHRY